MTRMYIQMLGLAALVNGRFEDRKDRGATAVEYGLLVGLIAIVLITALTAFQTQLSLFFTRVSTTLSGM